MCVPKLRAITVKDNFTEHYFQNKINVLIKTIKLSRLGRVALLCSSKVAYSSSFCLTSPKALIHPSFECNVVPPYKCLKHKQIDTDHASENEF